MGRKINRNLQVILDHSWFKKYYFLGQIYVTYDIKQDGYRFPGVIIHPPVLVHHVLLLDVLRPVPTPANHPVLLTTSKDTVLEGKMW